MLDKSRLTGVIPDSTTVKTQEIEKFDRLAKEWWDEQGKMKSAIRFNQARLDYIQSQIIAHFQLEKNANKALSGIDILDVGSGGGLLSEPLAQAGAKVTGIDASAVSVAIAKRHALQTRTPNLVYRHALAEQLILEDKQFAVVINAEVVEHVEDQQTLISQCCQLLKPGGLLILATLNKTLKSYLVAILGAEYIMRYLPIGTHDWRYFVSPKQLQTWVAHSNCTLSAQTGMALNPFTGNWRYTKDMSVNYCLCFVKAPPSHIN